MAAVCDICGKKPSFGMNVSHSHRRTKRRWNPNIQRVRAVVDGAPKRLHVCTSCIRAGKVTKPPRRTHEALDDRLTVARARRWPRRDRRLPSEARPSRRSSTAGGQSRPDRPSTPASRHRPVPSCTSRWAGLALVPWPSERRPVRSQVAVRGSTTAACCRPVCTPLGIPGRGARTSRDSWATPRPARRSRTNRDRTKSEERCHSMHEHAGLHRKVNERPSTDRACIEWSCHRCSGTLVSRQPSRTMPATSKDEIASDSSAQVGAPEASHQPNDHAARRLRNCGLQRSIWH